MRQELAEGATVSAKQEYLVRFNVSQRIEHLAIMVSFTILAFTGLPQKYAGASWSQWIILSMGGIETIRIIHRIFSFLFTASALYHLGGVMLSFVQRRFKPSMFFNLNDFSDAVAVLRYDLGISNVHPEFDRYDFRQKFEYWGVVFGGTIMILSGFLLMFPVFFTRLLPGQAIPVAKVFHSFEGLMAFIIIIIWHLYGAHLGPEKFPADTSIFTGKISVERMVKEHPLEHKRILAEREKETVKQTEAETARVPEVAEAKGSLLRNA